MQVSDFGLAKFQGESDTHVSTRVVGTFGWDEAYFLQFVFVLVILAFHVKTDS